MPKLAPAIVLATSIFTLTAVANAEIKILECHGPGMKDSMHELPSQSFYFKLDDKSGSVPWAIYDDIRNIKMQRFDADTLEFVAIKGDVNNPYSSITSYKFIVSRISGQGAVDVFFEQNHKLELVSVYRVDCHVSDKAF